MSDVRLIQKLLAPLRRRVLLLASRGVVDMVNDGGKEQRLQVTCGDATLDGLERLQDYGLTSNPPADAECLVVSLGGDRAHSVVVRVGDRRVRLTGLQPGEVAIYDDQGTRIVLRRGNKLDIIADEIRLGAEEPVDHVALAQKVLAELQKLQAHFAALEGILTGPPVPEPGVGAPSALQVALAAAIGVSPYPAPASVASAKVRSE